MPEGLKYLFDAAVAFALFLALMVVFAVDYFTSGPSKNTLENVRVLGGGKGNAKKLKLAVVKTREIQDFASGKVQKWDDMSKLLTALGDGYRHDLLIDDEIIRKHEDKTLGAYDIIFLTCHDIADADKLKDPLQTYVGNGGILYASDLRYDAIRTAFPDSRPYVVDVGRAQKMEADIVDPDLQKALGTPTEPLKKIPLDFNLGDWKPAAFNNVDVLIKGTYKEKSGAMATHPLMVRFKFDKGTVIFTSFHNEAQNSRVEEQLLQNLVFGLVTAGVDAELNSSLDKEGFKPQGSNLLSTPAKGKTEPKHYENKQTGTLRFGLGFRNEGYKLRFNIKSPSGKQFTQDCESTTILEVTDAEIGRWEYTVEALDAYANFAFRTTVGEKK